MEEQLIDLSGLNLPDAQPNVIDLSGLNLPDSRSEASNDISDPLDEISQNMSPAGIMRMRDESDSNYSYSGPAPFDPFQDTPRTPGNSSPKETHQVLQDLWNLYLTGGSTNSQAAAPEEEGLSHLNMLNVYKQWAIGGIDAILQALWAANQAVDVPIPYEPHQSPFLPPADANERAARLMGSFQLPALAGAAEGEPDLFENGGDVPNRATFGQATTGDYRSTFFAEHPELRGKVDVHHAVEQMILIRFPGVVTEEEIHSLENLRGIPKEISSYLHNSQIRREWNQFSRPFITTGSAPTKEQLLQKATEIDSKFGSMFLPPVGGE